MNVYIHMNVRLLLVLHLESQHLYRPRISPLSGIINRTVIIKTEVFVARTSGTSPPPFFPLLVSISCRWLNISFGSVCNGFALCRWLDISFGSVCNGFAHPPRCCIFQLEAWNSSGGAVLYWCGCCGG